MRLKLITISISVILASFCITNIAQAQAVPFFGEAENICELIENVFYFGVSLAGIAAMLVIMLGGIIYIVSFGSEEKKKTAMDLMGGALKGLLLALFSWTIFYIVNPYLLKCKVPTLPVEIPEYITPTYNPCIGQYVYEKKEKCDPLCQAQNFGECTKGNTAGCKVSEVAVGPPCSNEDCPYGYKCNTISNICEAEDLTIPVKTPPLNGWCCLPKGILACPTQVTWPLTSCFGPRCLPDNQPGHLFHTGLDIACPQNTPILAAGDGTIGNVGIDGEGKYYITITYSAGVYGEVTKTDYVHLHSASVTVGQSVSRGQEIGRGGTPSGRAHLHFEVYVGSPPKLTDPRPYLSEACFSSVCQRCSCDNYANGAACPANSRCDLGTGCPSI